VIVPTALCIATLNKKTTLLSHMVKIEGRRKHVSMLMIMAIRLISQQPLAI